MTVSTLVCDCESMHHVQGQESQQQDASCAITLSIVWCELCESGCEYIFSLFFIVSHGDRARAAVGLSGG